MFKLAEYQNNGSYLDLDGKKHTNADGIINAWEELDSLGFDLNLNMVPIKPLKERRS